MSLTKKNVTINPLAMTPKDLELISKANRLIDWQWRDAERMADQADTPEARSELLDIAKRKYRQEEYF